MGARAPTLGDSVRVFLEAAAAMVCVWKGWVLVLLMVEFKLVKRWVFIACCKHEIKVVDGFCLCGFFFH